MRGRIVDPAAIFGSQLWMCYYHPQLEPRTRGLPYGHYFWSTGPKDAVVTTEKLGMRGGVPEPYRVGHVSIGNLILGVPNPIRDLKRYLRTPTSRALLARATHSLAHLAYVGLRAGILGHRETVGDLGFVHELAHYAHFYFNPPSRGYTNPQDVRLALLNQVCGVVARVPGYLPANVHLWTLT
jgi:hypothetical protein